MPKTKILIEVSGGCVQSVTSTKDIEIFIVDHDSLECGLPEEFEKAGTCYSPDCVCCDGEFEKLFDEALNEHEQIEEEPDADLSHGLHIDDLGRDDEQLLGTEEEE